ncbi:AraC family transcriptional regulator [Microlunatus sp. GCM10028923]|uniref:AraC family transcriptional regulator n=1 Tax=Microlunatus sp. GCM10028923 TaxID=3273400 RepID=UPI00360846D2
MPVRGGRSFASENTGRQIAGRPVYGYRRVPGLPPVGVYRQHRSELPDRALPHAHDFLVLGFVVTGSQLVRLDGRDWRLRPGDLFLVAPGEVIDVEHGGPDRPAPEGDLEVWTAFFPPDAVDASALRAWHDHPLLAPFVRAGGGLQRIPVPEGNRAELAERFGALERELRDRREGFAEAALAQLTLLLVDVLRLAADVAGGLRLRDEPLLADVFAVIEERYAEPISLRDVADAVAITPAHLTTVVRRRSGRTVQQWITERRMIEARRLLAETDLTVAAIAGRLGFGDPGYFTRVFRREHGVPPQTWRDA